MIQSENISSRLLARNSIYNVLGQASPLLVALLVLPFIVRGLGSERFGIFSLAWVILGYFGVFDLGLGRATTKYAAEALAKRRLNDVGTIVWTSATIQFFLGVFGAVLLIVFTPILVERILTVAPSLITEAKETFYLLALSVPLMLVSTSLIGALEARQRFDLVNLIRIPSALAVYILSLAGVLLELQLPAIVLLIVLLRVAALLVLLLLNLHVCPELRKFSTSLHMLRTMITYGGWISVSNLVSPVITYFDRFLIGSVVSISAVSYYAAPYEFASKLLVVPTAVVGVLFPAFSTFSATGKTERLQRSLSLSLKYLVALMTPLTAILLIFAEDILRIWLGGEFARAGGLVFSILLIAVWLNAIGYVPFALMQAIGRPDVAAKYMVIELPIYIAVTSVLVLKLGITGAALAWCLRMLWTIPVFLLICLRIARMRVRAILGRDVLRGLAISAVMIFSCFVAPLVMRWNNVSDQLVSVGVALLIVLAYIFLTWRYAFDSEDHGTIRAVLHDLSPSLLPKQISRHV